METDQEIIKQIIAGQQEIYRELVSRYQQKVYSVAFKITRNEKDAEDIAQEVFIQAFKALSTYKFESSFSTWLYRIAVNRGLDWQRKNKKYQDRILYEQVTIENTESIEFLPEDSFISQEQKKAIHSIMNKLPPPYLDVIKLYYFDQLSYQEIANQLELANKTVESRLYRGRQMLKQLWLKEGVR